MMNKKIDASASTGVGAFVIFIAIIIVSSVTMATITITIQKISESAEKNTDDIENEFTGTIVIEGACYQNKVIVMETTQHREEVQMTNVLR